MTIKKYQVCCSGLNYYILYTGNIPLDEITNIAYIIKSILKKFDPNLKINISGSYRREKYFSDNIYILVYHNKYKTTESIKKSNILKDIVDILLKYKFLLKTKDGFTKNIFSGLCRYLNNPVRRIDIEVTGKCSFPVRSLHLTGSYVFIRYLRRVIESNNYKINNENILDKNNKIVCFSSEKSIFKFFNIPWITPEKRDASYLYHNYLFKESNLITEIYLKKTLFELH